MIKSILRYPGGKSKAVQKIISLIPPNIKEFREPMVGGGSVALVLKQTLPHVKVWINDLNYDLVCFWKTLRDYPEELIKELKRIKSLYKEGSFQITHGDYKRLLFEEGKGVFIFLDPPYYSTTNSRLYGKRGNLHTSFDHQRFAENMKKCKHLWLITYDDCEEVRRLFSFAYLYSWELQYGMSARKGREVLILNFLLKEKA